MISVTPYKYNFKLEEPISISFHTWYYRENVIVKLKYKKYTGLGEAAPFKPITGDSQEDVIRDLRRIKQIPLDPTKDSLKKLHDFLDTNTSCQTLKAAIDFAYHDLQGKIKGISTFKLYSKKPVHMNNSVTIFIKETAKETAKSAKKIFLNYPRLKILKIKLKGDKQDLNRVKAIKKLAPRKMSYCLDANQGFRNPRKAVEVLTEIGNVLENVVLVEEPCPKNDLKKLKYVKDNMKNMLVFADESAATLKDAKKVVKAQAAHGINIKLQKAGGIWPGKKIAEICKKANIKIMVGSMLEGPIAITAGVHFAVSTPNLILSDLDMDLDMVKHTRGEAKFVNGKRTLSIKPGLGVSLMSQKIKGLQKSGNLVFRKIA